MSKRRKISDSDNGVLQNYSETMSQHDNDVPPRTGQSRSLFIVESSTDPRRTSRPLISVHPLPSMSAVSTTVTTVAQQSEADREANSRLAYDYDDGDLVERLEDKSINIRIVDVHSITEDAFETIDESASISESVMMEDIIDITDQDVRSDDIPDIDV